MVFYLHLNKLRAKTVTGAYGKVDVGDSCVMAYGVIG